MPRKQTGLNKAKENAALAALVSGKTGLEMRLTPAVGRSVRLILHQEQKIALLDGHLLHLTSQEFALLMVLALHPGQPVSRETLLEGAWGYAYPCNTRTVDVHIQRLRQKLGVSCIETVFRQGYLLRANRIR